MLTIGVLPPEELETGRALFSALENVFDVRFVAGAPAGDSPCNGYIFVGTPAVIDQPVPNRFRALSFTRATNDDHVVGSVSFHDSPALDARLRGQRLVERHASPGHLVADGGSILASDSASNPLWVKKLSEDSEIDEVAIGLPHLTKGEALRDHVVPGKFLALVPMVHFLRELSREQHGNWEPPPLRATFVIDDPNLHWCSYGNVDYRSLAVSARAHGYHVGMATIPLDGWFVYPPAARLFQTDAQQLSLCVHGNDHSGPELGSSVSEAGGMAMLAQALRRIERLESRSGSRVSRVMVPPHESCSAQMLGLLMRLGFDAVSMTRPHPWISLDDQLSPYASSPDDVAAGWFPAELREDGFPILIRRGFWEPDEAPLRAFLDLPLVFYGHAGDLADGLESLESLAQRINSMPDVHWCSLGEIAATNYQSRRPGSAALEVRPFARRIRIDELDGVEDIAIASHRRHEPPLHLTRVGTDGPQPPLYAADGRRPVRLAHEVDHLEITLLPTDALDYKVIAPPPRRLKPITRRITTEARDRAVPYVSGLSRSLHSMRTGVSRGIRTSFTANAATQVTPEKDAG